MRAVRFSGRLALVVSLGAVLLLLLMFLAGRIEQQLYRNRVELLFKEIESVELGKTPWTRTQSQFAHWGKSLHVEPGCNSRVCSMSVELSETVYRHFSSANVFTKLDDYFRWRLGLSYAVGPFERLESKLLEAYLRLGGHPARVEATLAMRDGTVWDKGFHLQVETYGHPVYWSGDWRIQFSLLADVYSIDRFDRTPHFSPLHPSPKHPEYLIGRPSGCTICVQGWVRFTPKADPADVHRLMQLNFSCLTQRRPCVSQADIMPNAWAQYVAEENDR